MCTRPAAAISNCRLSELQGLDIDSTLLERLDPVFRLAGPTAHQAWNDAQIDGVDRGRVGVVFGNIVLPTETASAITREVLSRAFAEKLGVPVEPAAKTEPMNAFPAGLPAALVARALGLRGPAYTIDAACGSSLYSLKLAIDELRSGRADAMLCGGVSRPDPLYTQIGFSHLGGALSSARHRQSARSRCRRIGGRQCVVRPAAPATRRGIAHDGISPVKPTEADSFKIIRRIPSRFSYGRAVTASEGRPVSARPRLNIRRLFV